MPLPDKLAEILATEGIVVPEDFHDTIMGEYNADIAASAAESNTVIAQRDQMIRDLKAAAAIETIPDEAKEPHEDETDPDAEVDADFTDFFGEEGDDDDPRK